MKLLIILAFIICTFAGGTNSIDLSSDPINPQVYYENKQDYELAKQLPDNIKLLVDSFYKNDHIINVKIGVIKDIKNLP